MRVGLEDFFEMEGAIARLSRDRPVPPCVGRRHASGKSPANRGQSGRTGPFLEMRTPATKESGNMSRDLRRFAAIWVIFGSIVGAKSASGLEWLYVSMNDDTIRRYDISQT